MSTTIRRTTFVNDDGSGNTGSVWNSQLIGETIFDPIDEVYGGGQKDPFSLGGSLSVPRQFQNFGFLKPAVLTADTHNWSPKLLETRAFLLEIESDSAINLTGIDGSNMATGQMLLLHNTGGFVITIQNNDAGSLFGNRILCPGNVDYSLIINRAVLISFNADTFWTLLGH